MLKLLMLLSVSVFGLSGLACALHAQDFSGAYTIASPDGPLRLTLRQDADGFVSGTLATPGGVTFQVEGVSLIDEDDEASVEGMLTSEQGRGEFSFYADDEDEGYYLLVTPYDATGTPRLDQAAEYRAQRGEGVDPGSVVEAGAGQEDYTQSVSPPPGDTARDARLVGVWATQVIMNTPDGSMATQLFMEIRADGTLLDLGARSMGSFPDAGIDSGLDGGGDVAVWRTEGTVLLVSYAGSPWVPLAQYEVSGSRLLLAYYDGDRKLWHRQ